MSVSDNSKRAGLSCLPFLKWVGGKRWLTSKLKEYLPSKIETYYEPFLGGGAVFFALPIKKAAVLSDINPRLINAYRQVKNRPYEVIKGLNEKRIAKNEYYTTRNSKCETKIKEAIQLIYLTRTSFNGLYRVNRQGTFNVPFGYKYNSVLIDEPNLKVASKKLQCANLICGDFSETVDSAKKGDVVYFDPPYTVKHNDNGFRKYNESIFSWDDQIKLAKVANKLVKKGVHIVISNAYHQDILLLYRNFTIKEVMRSSVLAANSKYRTSVKEAIIISKNF